MYAGQSSVFLSPAFPRELLVFWAIPKKKYLKIWADAREKLKTR